MSISEWVMSVTSAIAVGTLADIIIADGGTKKFVKGIAALIVFAALIAPIPALFGGELDFDPAELTQDNEYLQEIDRSYLEGRTKIFSDSLEKEGLGKTVVNVHSGSGEAAGEAVCVVVTLYPDTFTRDMTFEEAETAVKIKAEAYFSLPQNMVIVVGA